jgi:hypothetical protein
MEQEKDIIPEKDEIVQDENVEEVQNKEDEKSVELTKDALMKLKGLSLISNEVVIESDTIGFVDSSESILCFYDWKVKIDEPFGILDINNFLSVLGIYKKPTFDFKKDAIIISEGTSESKYKKTRIESIIYNDPPESLDVILKMVGEVKSEFRITEDQFKNLKNQNGCMRNPHLKIEGKTMSLMDKENEESCNMYSFDIDTTNEIERTYLKYDYFNLIIPDTYIVKVYDNIIIVENDVLHYALKKIAD